MCSSTPATYHANSGDRSTSKNSSSNATTSAATPPLPERIARPAGTNYISSASIPTKSRASLPNRIQAKINPQPGAVQLGIPKDAVAPFDESHLRPFLFHVVNQV